MALLLDRGAEVDARNTVGLTPLMALLSDHEDELDSVAEGVRVLAGRGADVHAATTPTGGRPWPTPSRTVTTTMKSFARCWPPGHAPSRRG
jgi:hypothetical protein